jgi:hypothetical protein
VKEMSYLQPILMGISLVLLLTGIILMSMRAGDSNSLADIQKSLGVIAGMSSIPIIFLGFTYYMYIKENTSAFMPTQIILTFINLLLVITAVSVSVLVKQ